MAYLRKDDVVMINSGGSIQSIVVDVQFRRYAKFYKDKKTGERKKRWKAVPFAVCKVFNTTMSDVKAGSEFVIAGYKLKNTSKDGEKILILQDKYLAEFADNYGNEWVAKLIEESKKARSKKAS